MVITAVSLWIVVAVLIIFDSKAESTKWAGASAFLCSLNGFSFIWENALFPLMLPIFNNSQLYLTQLHPFTAIFIAISIFFSPYSMLMFGISYTNILDGNKKLVTSAIAFLPPLLSFVFFLTQMRAFSSRHDLMVHLRVMSSWAILYVLICIALLLYAGISEKSGILKKERVLVGIIAVPLVAFSLYINHLAQEIDKSEAFMYNIWIVSIHFMSFLYFIVRFSFNNKQNQEGLHKSFSSGLSFANHAIKNDISKLSLCLNNISAALTKVPTDVEVARDSSVIASRSIEHLNAIIQKIYSSTKLIVLKEEKVLISSILDQSITALNPNFAEKQIFVTNNYAIDACLICDPKLLVEAFGNIFRNSLEAMSSGGQLIVDIDSTKGGILITVNDNGSGISKENIRRVGEPFYSTKRNDANFGLGLSFAINIFHKHEGELKIQSNENVGTTVSVFFPKKRIIDLHAPPVLDSGMVHVQN